MLRDFIQWLGEALYHAQTTAFFFLLFFFFAVDLAAIKRAFILF